MATNAGIRMYEHDEKRKYSPAEFLKAQMACDFVVDFTKAISRSGYYDPTHPGSRKAKWGLYDLLMRALGTEPEVMLTCREEGEQADIFIIGILDEPASMRRLTKTATAILFIPKLREFFERKNLVSITIKKKITREHFESFVDIMSEPLVEGGEESGIGDRLTQILVDADISEVSTVFKNDTVFSAARLPWRVAITLRRLAKDLKVIPMFRHAGEDDLKRVKIQIVNDILRPLRHADLLKDLLVNCDVIAGATHIGFDELAHMSVDAIPEDLLVDTTQLILDEYEMIRDHEQFDNTGKRHRRRTTVEIILRMAAGRILAGQNPDAADLLERLYGHGIISLEALPEELRRRITTRMIACEIVSNTDAYVKKIHDAASAADMRKLVHEVTGVIPELVRQEEWQAIRQVAESLDEVAPRRVFSSGDSGLPADLADSIFDGSVDAMIRAYGETGMAGRQKMNGILMRMGSRAIEILDGVFASSESPEVWKSALEVLMHKGEPAREWALQVLADPDRSASIQNAVLLLIGYVGHPGDLPVVRNYLSHDNPRLRMKALDASMRLNEGDAETIIIDALRDEDEKVRQHAASSLSLVSSLSEDSVRKLVALMRTAMPAGAKESAHQSRRLALLIKAAGTLAGSPHRELLEEELLAMTAELLNEKRGFFKLFRAAVDKERLEIVTAGIAALGKLGGSKSLGFLKSLARGDSPVSGVARETIHKLEHKFA